MDLEKLKYPIGQANIPTIISTTDIKNWIEIIENFPNRLDQLTKNLSEEQLNTVYRKDGWTIRQVVHHCYDSHHNSYLRFKWTLTEDKPVIKAYFEDRFAELVDSTEAPILLSIHAIYALHAKWVYLLKSLSQEDLDKVFIHPENNNEVSLKENIGIYAWHCNHHYEHINQLLIHKGWK
ncbi:putative metal-dependent hydrolase [Polaribacter sp.]|nr:putative metal-dependent hydrolase [Polaribacter sp.]